MLLLRKTVLVLLMTFLAPLSAGVQSLSTILLLIAFLVIHTNKQPFYDQKLNNLETTSLIAQICIIYLGLFYQAGKNDSFLMNDSMVCSIMILLIIASVQFIALFVFRMRLEMLKATVSNHSLCFRLLSCGRVKDRQAFIEEHKVG